MSELNARRDYVPQLMSVVDVMTPPMDNFNPGGGYAANSSYLNETVPNGMMSSYQNNPTMMVTNMVKQMQLIVKDNQDLKKSIQLNNQELQQKYHELQQWKECKKRDAATLKQNYNKARTVVMRLRDGNALLKAHNTKLEIQISRLAEANPNLIRNEEVENLEGGVALDSASLQTKYLATVDNLERQLKEALQSRNEAETRNQRLSQVNMTLQSRMHSDQQRLYELEKVEVEKRKLDRFNQGLLKELEEQKERCRTAEKTTIEVKTQLVKVIEEVKLYQNQAGDHKAQICVLQSEGNELKSHILHYQERLKKSAKETQSLQMDKERAVSELQKVILDKTKSFDDLFHEYERIRVDHERTIAESTQTHDLDNLLARLLCAEESLEKKQREVAEIEERWKVDSRSKDATIKKQQEDVSFFKAQADVYKQDFLMEREDRTTAQGLNDQLKSQLEQYNRYESMRR